MELIYQNSRIFNGETNEYTLKAKKLFETVEATLGLYQVRNSIQKTFKQRKLHLRLNSCLFIKLILFKSLGKPRLF